MSESEHESEIRLHRYGHILAVNWPDSQGLRTTAVARPAAFEPDLAASLSNLGASLSEVGRREEALAATAEAAEIRRRLAAARPDAFEPELARGLWGYAWVRAAGKADLAQALAAAAARRRAEELGAT